MITSYNKNYKNYPAWKKSINFINKIYFITKKYPKEEKYSLINQMKKCAVSIPSNIAEGYRRGSTKQYIHFLSIAFGSGAELDTQILISKNLGYIDNKKYIELTNELDEIMKILNSTIQTLTSKVYTN